MIGSGVGNKMTAQLISTLDLYLISSTKRLFNDVLRFLWLGVLQSKRWLNQLSHCYSFSINFVFDISLVASVILSKKTVYSIVISDFVFVLGHVRVIGICNQFRF